MSTTDIQIKLSKLETRLCSAMKMVTLSDLRSGSTFTAEYNQHKGAYKLFCNDSINRFFAKWDKRIQRQRAELEKMAGTVPAPNTIIRTELTRINVMDQDLRVLWGDDESESERLLSDIEIDYKPQLQTWQAGFILDTLYVLLQSAGDPHGGLYTINTTVAEFFDKGKGKYLSDKEKRTVKEMLFISEDLRRVRFTARRGEQLHFKRTHFIQVISEEGREFYSAVSGEKIETIDRFTLLVNAKLFLFLYGPDGVGNAGAGFLMIPKYLQIKIISVIDRFSYLSGDESFQRQKDVFRHSVLYAVRKWLAGKEKRSGAMIISYNELHEKKIVPRCNDVKRRIGFLDRFQAILQQLINDGELSGAKSVKLCSSKSVSVLP